MRTGGKYFKYKQQSSHGSDLQTSVLEVTLCGFSTFSRSPLSGSAHRKAACRISYLGYSFVCHSGSSGILPEHRCQLLLSGTHFYFFCHQEPVVACWSRTVLPLCRREKWFWLELSLPRHMISVKTYPLIFKCNVVFSPLLKILQKYYLSY